MSLMTGTQLSVTGTMSPSRARIAVDSYSIIEDAFPTRRLQAMSATAPPVRSDISAIIFLISPCGYPAAANKADVENLLFGGSYNLDGYIRQCSANKAVLSRSSVVVGPVQMPCNGVDNRGRSWGGDGLCGWAELNGWQDWTANYASETLGLDMRTFKHRVLVVPTGLCSFVGQALLGARERDEYGDYGWSQVWLGGNYADKPQNYFHEIGHNYYLSHASTLENVEYGEQRCRCVAYGRREPAWPRGAARQLNPSPFLC